MHFILLTSILLNLMVSLTPIRGENSIDNDLYGLEQAIEEFEFKEVGSINLRLLKQNQNSAQLQTLNANENIQKESTQVYNTRLESNDFDEKIQEQIKSSERVKNALYRLRLCRKATASICYASTFTNLYNIIESGFRINLTIHINSNNRPNALSIKTSTPEAAQSPFKKQYNHLVMFTSVQGLKPGQQPDTESYLEKVRKEMEQKEKSESGDNQSFLSKYWIYIVPFVVIMFLANIANPEGAAS